MRDLIFDLMSFCYKFLFCCTITNVGSRLRFNSMFVSCLCNPQMLFWYCALGPQKAWKPLTSGGISKWWNRGVRECANILFGFYNVGICIVFVFCRPYSEINYYQYPFQTVTAISKVRWENWSAQVEHQILVQMQFQNIEYISRCDLTTKMCNFVNSYERNYVVCKWQVIELSDRKFP